MWDWLEFFPTWPSRGHGLIWKILTMLRTWTVIVTNNSWHLLDACCAFCLLLRLYLDLLTWSSPRGSDPCIRRKPRHTGPVPVGLPSTWVLRSGWALVPQVNTAFGWTSAEGQSSTRLEVSSGREERGVFSHLTLQPELLVKQSKWKPFFLAPSLVETP